LKELVKYEKSTDQYFLKFHICFGNVLQEFYHYWKAEKEKGNIYRTWKDWLQENIEISDSHARKKRELAAIIGKYSNFQYLSILFNEMYSKKNDIESMLFRYPEVQKFWSGSK